MKSYYSIDMLVSGNWVYVARYRDEKEALVAFRKIKKDCPRRVFRLSQVFSLV